MLTYREMEALAREHAELDKKAAVRWIEEAEIWARLQVIEERSARLREGAPAIWERHAKRLH
jgi:hypothetical protein